MINYEASVSALFLELFHVFNKKMIANAPRHLPKMSVPKYTLLSNGTSIPDPRYLHFEPRILLISNEIWKLEL